MLPCFKHPEYISENINAIADYLAIHFPGYFFCSPCKTFDGSTLYIMKKAVSECSRSSDNSHSVIVAENTAQTYEPPLSLVNSQDYLLAFLQIL
jgi:hypothetical protein